ncbi:NUDIX domain-containing protein [Streptomyces avicenniae]|uniref:NUDIX domain-containing protein n=1 Tax=Streptomyces avicenniae TaxID=500153 RepID=UPI00069AE670|nr:NUDIX domain-containing protein [Streptomyces avicenniae]
MAYTYGRTISHCPYCGIAYAVEAGWPRDCPGCGETHWANPLPVAVAMLQVRLEHGLGLVVVRRDIEPCRGELALPGGYMELGESWQQSVARELREETGLIGDAADVTLFDVHSGDRTVNVYGLLPPVDLADLPESAPTDETTEWLVLDKPVPLAFPGHDTVVEAYFSRVRGADAGTPAR